MGMKKCLLLALVTCLSLISHGTYAQAVRPPEGLQAINPKDSLSARYQDRSSAIMRYAYADSTMLAEREELRRTLSPSIIGVANLPWDFRKRAFGWEFSVDAFERQIAYLKTSARQLFDPAAFNNSIRNAAPKYIQFTRKQLLENKPGSKVDYVKGRGYEDLRMIDPYSMKTRKYFWKLFTYSNPYLIKKVDGQKMVFRQNIGGSGILRYFAPLSELQAEWHVQEPLIIYPLSTWLHTGAPLGTMAIFPVKRKDVVYGYACFYLFNGGLSTHSDPEKSLDFKKYPPMTLEEATKLVEERTGERVIDILYTSLLHPMLPVPVAITRSDNVYIVDPLIREVW